ncbi:MAG: DUF1365 domain-containing protein [Rickettsiales bacterium]|nr:DUF1365 domain-containing protein [Rickettsiales bacterium]
MAKIITVPLILPSSVMHARVGAKTNNFTYSSTYFAIPLAKISSIKSRFLSFNGRNIFAINDCNYVNKNSIFEILKEHQILGVENVTLVTCPTTLFYVFNPVSFYLCFDKNQKLIAALAEVNNRSNQTHSYLIFNQNLSEIKPDQWLEAQKEFYVSPFLERRGTYKFRFVISDSAARFYINYFLEDKLVLATYLACKFREFNDSNLLLQFVQSPFATLKTTFLIHWQALKLFAKGIKFNKCPLPLKHKITLNKK